MATLETPVVVGDRAMVGTARMDDEQALLGAVVIARTGKSPAVAFTWSDPDEMEAFGEKVIEAAFALRQGIEAPPSEECVAYENGHSRKR